MGISQVCPSSQMVLRDLTLTIQTAMTPGGTTQEVTQLNMESLWSGGLWQDPVRLPNDFDYTRLWFTYFHALVLHRQQSPPL